MRRVWLLCECVYPCHVTTTVVTAGQLTLFICVHVEMKFHATLCTLI